MYQDTELNFGSTPQRLPQLFLTAPVTTATVEGTGQPLTADKGLVLVGDEVRLAVNDLPTG